MTVFKGVRDLTLKSVFLIDGSGAVFSAVMLGLVLPGFIQHIGLTAERLYGLTIPAVALAAYSWSCFLFAAPAAKRLLWPVIVGNILYCVLTVSTLWLNRHELRWAGYVYFIGEILAICAIVSLEISTVMRNQSSTAKP